MKIFLDTDIGTNIDDSFALLYLLKKAGNSLLGVSTVSGDTSLRARIAAAFIANEKLEIPVFSGNENPLFGVNKAKYSHMFNEPAGSHAEMSHLPDLKPWDFLKEKVDESPGEIDVLCLGPATNMAIFLQKYPEHFNRLKSIRMMAGVFCPVELYHNKIETNANYDPPALKNVLSQATFPIFITGVDVSVKTRCDFDDMERKVEENGYEIIFNQLIQFRAMRNVLILHDLLIAISLFKDLIKYETGKVKVEVTRIDRMGETTFTPHPESNLHVAVDADIDEFWKEVVIYLLK